MKPFKPIPPLSKSDILRFDSKVPNKPEEGCWLWTASKITGYGVLRVQGRNIYAHRIAYMLSYGSFPEELELDHTCHNRACVRPSHLEPVSHSENCIRGFQRDGRVCFRLQKNHCKNGHEYTQENTHLYKGARICRACKRDAGDRKRAKKQNQIRMLTAI